MSGDTAETSETLEPAETGTVADMVPALFFTMIEANPETVGALVDYADKIPGHLLLATILALGATLYREHTSNGRTSAWRRRLVIFGRLVERLIFQEEAVPKRRDAVI